MDSDEEDDFIQKLKVSHK
jgi:DNA polymerase alpha subunit A